MKASTSLNVKNPDRFVLIYFIIFILTSGGGPVAMRISYAEMPPFWMSFLRFGLGALIYWILAFIRRIHVPRDRSLAGPLLYGVFSIGISFALLAWGLVNTPASLAAIFLALVPLLTVIFSALEGVEPLNSRGIFGSLLSVGGTIFAVGAAATTNVISFIHIGALTLGAAFLAQGGVLIKRYPSNPPIMTNALAMTAGAAILALVSLLGGESWVIPSQLSTWAALGYLVFFVSLLSLLMYIQVLNKWTASGASYGYVIIPFVTVIISTVLTGEQVTLKFLLGIMIVVTGVVIGALLHPKVKMTAECAAC